MTRNEKDTINRRTENRRLLQRMKSGLEAVRDTPHKRALLAAYLVGAVLVWLFRAYLFGLDTYGMFSPCLLYTSCRKYTARPRRGGRFFIF